MLRLYGILASRCGYAVEYIDELELPVAFEILDCVDRVHLEARREELIIAAYGMSDQKGRRSIDRAFGDPWKATKRARMLKGKKKAEAARVEAEVREKYSRGV